MNNLVALSTKATVSSISEPRDDKPENAQTKQGLNTNLINMAIH